MRLNLRHLLINLLQRKSNCFIIEDRYGIDRDVHTPNIWFNLFFQGKKYSLMNILNLDKKIDIDFKEYGKLYSMSDDMSMIHACLTAWIESKISLALQEHQEEIIKKIENSGMKYEDFTKNHIISLLSNTNKE